MDAITMLKEDHSRLRGLFKQFHDSGPRALKTKEKLVDKMIEELSVHAVIEEQVFYPAVRGALSDLGEEVLEALEEHHIVKWTLSELDDMAPDAENYTAKVTVMMENVEHHIKEEEGQLMPTVRKAMSRRDLEALGEQLHEARGQAPVRPHPRMPTGPVAKGAQGLLGRAADSLQQAKDRALDTLTP
jgi:iron-sulfur cluster repair protein YtfE (RIC family)